MEKIVLFTIISCIAYADETFTSIESEVIGMSLIAIFIYVVARLNAIMNKKNKYHDKNCQHNGKQGH